MKVRKEWLKTNGKPLDDAELKIIVQAWDQVAWNKYLNWYQTSCRETHLPPATYDRICEHRESSIFEDLGSHVSEEDRAYGESLLQSLPLTEAKVLRLHFFDGLTDIEIASKLSRSRPGVNLIKNRALSRLRRGMHGERIAPCQSMRGMIPEEVKTQSPSIWDRSLSGANELGNIEHPYLRSALGALSENQRQILEMRFWLGLSIRKVARLMGMSAYSVDMICEAAVKKVKDRILNEVLRVEESKSCA